MNKKKIYTKKWTFDLFKKFEESGLSQREFCKKAKVGLSTFSRWKTKWWEEYKKTASEIFEQALGESGNKKADKKPAPEDKAPTAEDNLRDELQRAGAKINELEQKLWEQGRETAELEQDCAVLFLRERLIRYRATEKRDSATDGLMSMVAEIQNVFSKALQKG